LKKSFLEIKNGKILPQKIHKIHWMIRLEKLTQDEEYFLSESFVEVCQQIKF
jgi:hypothetical protein